MALREVLCHEGIGSSDSDDKRLPACSGMQDNGDMFSCKSYHRDSPPVNLP